MAFAEQRCLLINAVFCWHNVAGIKVPKVSLLNCCRRLLNSDGDYWCSVSFTNLRLSMNWSAETIQIVKTNPKKIPSQTLSFASLFRMNQFFTRKKSHFTIPVDRGVGRAWSLRVFFVHHSSAIILVDNEHGIKKQWSVRFLFDGTEKDYKNLMRNSWKKQGRRPIYNVSVRQIKG